ncbi:hypothetical protein [Cardinium endosymbiont of Philonthus spinipes]|uniref:hypothetical protein n=1 Tax=Cardinium endosymbiont of Philonthus spinipes TaxID=3077941 RepID=UPI00313DBCE0
MLRRKAQQKKIFFVHYYLFYTLVVAYLPFVMCGCLRGGLLPKPNLTLASLPESIKEQYFTLTQMVDDSGKERLEKVMDRISSQSILKDFIDKSLQNHIAYNALLQLLPKPERAVLKQKFDKSFDIHDMDGQIDAQKKLIDQCASDLKMIQHAAIPTRQHYIDLLEILPDHKATALKNKIVQLTRPDEADQLIASWLPKWFGQLDDRAQESFLKLSDRRRQEFLKDLFEAPIRHKEQEAAASKAAQPNDSDVIPSVAQLDIHKLLEEKHKEQQAQQEQEEAIPQDEWGDKLPLEGKQRKEFLLSILPFKQEDRKSLKRLFNQAESESIYFFVRAYREAFSPGDRIKLLKILICLYRKDQSLTIKLCNRPDLLTTGESLRIVWIAGWSGTGLLTKLREAICEIISREEEDNYMEP